MAKKDQIKAGNAYIELKLKSEKFRQSLRQAQQRLNKFAQSVAVVGTRIVAIGGAGVAAMAACTRSFMAAGDAMDKMSARTGVSVEALSQLKFAAEQSGAAISDIENGLKTLQNKLEDAGRGKSKAIQAFQAIGLSFEYLRAQQPEQQLNLIAAAINRLPTAAAKTKASMELLGNTALVPMLGNMQALRAEADKLGLTMSTTDAQAAANLVDQVNILNSQMKMLFFEVGSALAPELIKLAEYFKTVMIDAVAWIKQNHGLIVSIAKIAAKILAFGAALLAISAIIKAVALVVGILGTAFTVLQTIAVVTAKLIMLPFISLPAAIIAAVTLVTGLLMYFQGYFDGVMESVGATFKETFQGIKDALAAGDIELAAKIMLTGLNLIWIKLTTPLKNYFWDMVDSITEAILEIMVALAKALSYVGIDTLKDWGFDEGALTSLKQDSANRRKGYENDIRNEQEELSKLTGEAKKKAEEAKQKAEEANKPTDPSQFTFEIPLEALAQIQQPAIQQTIDKTVKGGSFGSFFADQLSYMMGGNAADRTARATEQTAELLREQNRKMDKKGGLKYAK